MLFPGHVLHHHACPDLRGICRTHEVQHHDRVHGSVGTFIYCPLAHWLWGGGVLAYGSQHAKEFSGRRALDFAGGTVVHISSGVSALICALLLGKRLGYGIESIPPPQHDLHGHGGRDAMGRLVRIQRRQRPV